MIDPVSQTILRRIEERVKAEPREGNIAYRKQCPRCMKWQVKEVLMKEGCFKCGWKQNKAR
ncbi:MAG: hypothetical protein V1672_01735 [Candidatus Diapherotrites archaeon]